MKYMFLIIVSMVILNCGSSRKRWVEQNCNEGNGYANGQKDAQSGRNFNADFARKCSPENIEITRKGYLDGYKSSGGKNDTTVIENSQHEHKYGQDIFEDIVHAVNKNPSKKKSDQKEKVNETVPKN